MISSALDNSVGDVVGHVGAKAQIEAAMASGKLHHGWIFSGPRGVGKSKLARLMAAALLSGRKTLDVETLDQHVCGLIDANSHPDYRIIKRPVDDKGKLKSDIPVSSIRDIVDFFSLRPAMGGWRIVIIDSIDELNRSGANALLKTLEEPPENSLLILVSHGENETLPTIKSRCRKLTLNQLSDSETEHALILSGYSVSEANNLAKMAEGRPGLAAARADKDVQKAVSLARKMTGQTSRDLNALPQLLMAASKSEPSFDAVFDVFISKTRDEAKGCGDSRVLAAGAWANAYRDLCDIRHETKGLNMDKAQATSAALALIQRTMRQAAKK